VQVDHVLDWGVIAGEQTNHLLNTSGRSELDSKHRRGAFLADSIKPVNHIANVDIVNVACYELSHFVFPFSFSFQCLLPTWDGDEHRVEVRRALAGRCDPPLCLSIRTAGGVIWLSARK